MIGVRRSLIPACDVPSLDALAALVGATAPLESVGAYKIGLALALRYGLPRVVEVVRGLSGKPVIYDHQKAATDIPETGAAFAAAVREAGCDAAILFPLAGPATLEAWIAAFSGCGLRPIVGVEMTHPRFLSTEGGLVDPNRLPELYRLAAELGVVDFVVPGNKPERIRLYRDLLGPGAVLYSPGFISQGGRLSEASAMAGDQWHAIVGRALTQAVDARAAAESLALALV